MNNSCVRGMDKVSYIGDMWKCVQHLKNRFEDENKVFVEILSIKIQGRFAYAIFYPIITSHGNFAFLNLKDTEELHKEISNFNVNFDHVIARDGDTTFYGICIM